MLVVLNDDEHAFCLGVGDRRSRVANVLVVGIDPEIFGRSDPSICIKMIIRIDCSAKKPITLRELFYL